jgi:hypothetical protein
LIRESGPEFSLHDDSSLSIGCESDHIWSASRTFRDDLAAIDKIVWKGWYALRDEPMKGDTGGGRGR